jgi:hypothetical protein
MDHPYYKDGKFENVENVDTEKVSELLATSGNETILAERLAARLEEKLKLRKQ